MTRVKPRVIATVTFSCLLSVAQAQDYKPWEDYGGGADSSRFTALDQVKQANVKQLEVAWTYYNGSADRRRSSGFTRSTV